MPGDSGQYFASSCLFCNKEDWDCCNLLLKLLKVSNLDVFATISLDNSAIISKFIVWSHQSADKLKEGFV